VDYQFERAVHPAKYAKRTPAGLETPTKGAHKVIKDKIIDGACPADDFSIFRSYENSLVLLKKYATLDWQHCMDIFRVENAIRAYAVDTKRKKPLNIVMHASPGTGKSHFVECLADAMKEDGVGQVTVNMTSIGGLDDLSGPLDEVRNLRVKGKLPILFLDEFDSSPQNYALLLPLLWDGKVVIGGRTIELGKFVAILAGSKREIGSELDKSRDMKRDAGKDSVEDQPFKLPDSKLPDLVSRINGPEITIPDLDLVDQKAGRCRKVDKVCLTIALLKERFGSDLRKVPWALLKFVSDTKFQYGVRSITNLVDSIERVNLIDGALRLIDLKFPFGAEKRLQESHLPIHIHEENGIHGIVERWKNLCQCDKLVEFELDPGTLLKFSQDFFDLWLLKKARGK
jgi:Torsin